MKGYTERLRDAWPLRVKGCTGTKSEILVLVAGHVLTASLAVLVVFAAVAA